MNNLDEKIYLVEQLLSDVVEGKQLNLVVTKLISILRVISEELKVQEHAIRRLEK